MKNMDGIKRRGGRKIHRPIRHGEIWGRGGAKVSSEMKKKWSKKKGHSCTGFFSSLRHTEIHHGNGRANVQTILSSIRSTTPEPQER